MVDGEAAMGALVVVVAEPDYGWTKSGKARRRPSLEHGLDKALGFAVGLGRVGPGPQVAQAEGLAGLAEEMTAVAGAVVGHHAPHADAVAGEPDHRAGKDGAQLSPALSSRTST